jgi:hypothetical protein
MRWAGGCARFSSPALKFEALSSDRAKGGYAISVAGGRRAKQLAHFFPLREGGLLGALAISILNRRRGGGTIGFFLPLPEGARFTLLGRRYFLTDKKRCFGLWTLRSRHPAACS